MNRHVSQARRIRAHRVSPARMVAPTRYDTRTVHASTHDRVRAENDAIIRDATIDELRDRMLGHVVGLVASLLGAGVLGWLFFASSEQMATHPIFAADWYRDPVAAFCSILTPFLCLAGTVAAAGYSVLTITELVDTGRALVRARRDEPRADA